MSQQSPREIQQLFFENLGCREYDCFKSSEEAYLKLKIGYTFYGPPESERSDLNRDFTPNQCYNPEQNIVINNIFKIIKSCSVYNENVDDIFVSFLFNCFYYDNKENAVGCSPIFRVKKCTNGRNGKSCSQYIDENLRVYKNWNDYLKNNKLPKALMCVPQDGKYVGNDQNEVVLDILYSPACSLGTEILKITDGATSVVSAVSASIAAASLIPAVTVAPILLAGTLVTGAVIGVYSVIRSSIALHDRRLHKQSISLANDESRNCYLNIAAGATGAITTGATKAAAIALGKGAIIGKSAATALVSFNIFNLTINGCNIANSMYFIIRDIKNKRNPSFLDVMHLSTTLLFFGHAVVNFQTASAIYRDSQQKTLSETIKMRSQDLWNKAKKTFFNADVTTAENNSSLRIINDSNDYCQTIVTPGIPEKTGESPSFVMELLEELMLRNGIVTLINISTELIENKDNVITMCKIILMRFEITVQKLLVKILDLLLGSIIKDAFDALEQVFPKSEKIVIFLNFIVNFLKLKTTEMELEYQAMRADAVRDQQLTEDEYDISSGVSSNNSRRMINFLKLCAMRMISGNGQPHSVFFRDLVAFFWEWLQVKIEQKNAEQRQNSQNSSGKRIRIRKSCNTCGGYYFC